MFLVWLLGVGVFGDDYRTAAVEGDGVPVEVATVVFAGVSTVAAFVAGYKAPHTFRADLDADEIATPILPRDVERGWSGPDLPMRGAAVRDGSTRRGPANDAVDYTEED